jgi:hypothetical protein
MPGKKVGTRPVRTRSGQLIASSSRRSLRIASIACCCVIRSTRAAGRLRVCGSAERRFGFHELVLACFGRLNQQHLG